MKQEVEVMNRQAGSLTDYDCPKCLNKGFIYKLKETNDGFSKAEITATPCDCQKIRSEIARLKSSGLSRLVDKYKFSNFRADDKWQKVIKQSAKQYSNNPTGWFYIGGQPGCGKTHICTAIVNELIKNGRSAKYMLWQDDIATLKGFANDIDNLDKMLNQFKRADFLYIDDFFKARQGESVTTASVNMTFRIINHRYNENLCTIISSELSIADIINIDEALGSRITEMCGNRAYFISRDTSKNYRFRKQGEQL